MFLLKYKPLKHVTLNLVLWIRILIRSDPKILQSNVPDPKPFLSSSVADSGSGKNLFRIPDPGVKKAPDPGSGSATLQDPEPK